MTTEPALVEGGTHSEGNGHATHPPADASAERELAREGLRALSERRALARTHGPVDLDRRTLFGPIPRRPRPAYLAVLALCPLAALGMWSIPGLSEELSRIMPWWAGTALPTLFALGMVVVGLESPGGGQLTSAGMVLMCFFAGLTVPRWIHVGGVGGALLVVTAAAVLVLVAGLLVPYATVIAVARFRPPASGLASLNTFARWIGFADALLPLRVGILMRAGYASEAVELIRARRRFVRPGMQQALDQRLGVALVMIERDLDEAEGLLRTALEDAPHEAGLHIALGMCLHLQDRHGEAVGFLEPMGRFIDTLPGAQMASISFAAGDSLLHLGRTRDAAPWLKKSRAWIERERAAHGAPPGEDTGACCGGEGATCDDTGGGGGEAR